MVAARAHRRGGDGLLARQGHRPAQLAPLGQREALAVYRSGAADDVDWTYVSPAAVIGPGERTGRYRTGTDQLLVDAQGESRISYDDFAAAVLDELERPQFVRRRMTVAY